MSPSRQLPEALLAHRQWVRDLARRLVGDDATADDIEQQTWLSAVLSPPRHASAPKAWLATIVRNWVSKLRRGEERRAQRERAATHHEPAPSTAEIVAEAEAHRRVVEAVFALAEPFRTTVILRFFENLPLADVAARTATPVETAKSRIRRALQLLRANLEQGGGGQRGWLVTLAPLVKGAAGASTKAVVLEALIMSTKHKILVFAALLLGAAALWTVVPNDPAPAIPAASVPAVVDRTAAVAGGVAPSNSPAERPDENQRQPADARGVVPVRVLTWSGTPIGGATVSVAEPRETWATRNELAPEPSPRAQATTDAKGEVTFSDLPAGVWSFIAAKAGFCRAGRPDVIVRDASRAVPVVIHLGAGYVLEGTVTDGVRRPIAGAIVTTYPTSSAMVRPRTTTDAQGRFRLDALAAGPAYVAAALPGGIVSTVETIQIPEIERLDLVLRTGGVLTGKVTERGSSRPIASAKVTASTVQTGSYRTMSANAITDQQGRYVIDALGEGLIREVTAEKEGYVHVLDVADGNFDTMIPFRDGGTWTRDLQMGRGGRLVVTVRGPGGVVAGSKVRLRQQRSPREMEPVITDAAGRAVFAAVLPGRLLVDVRADGLYQPDLPVDWWPLVNDPSAKNRWRVEVREGEEVSVEVEMTHTASIAGRVLGPDGQGLEGVRIGPLKADARSCVVSAADGSFWLAGLRASATAALSLVKDGWIAIEQPAAKIPDSGELRGLELRMRLAPRVQGTVRWSGVPPSEAWVQVSLIPEREEHWQEEFRWANTPRAPIAADGSYEAAIPGSSGRFVVRAVATLRTPVVSAPVRITDSGDPYRVDIDLSGGATLSGRVVVLDATEAVPSARIRLTWLAPGIDPRRIVRGPDGPPAVAIADRTGSFAVTGLLPGRYELRVAADGFLEESVELQAPGSDVVVSLPPALSIEGHVVYGDGRPVPAAQISPEPQQGNRAMWTSIEQITFSGPDGRFKVPRVHPGQFRLRVQPPRTGLANFRACQSGVVTAGARDVRVVVEAGATISGSVTDAQGRGLPGIGVGARKPGSREGGVGVETLQDGSFTVIGLDEGAFYTLTVNANNRNGPYASLQRHDVAAGTSGLQFVLERGLAIAGTVVDGEGKPVRNLEVSASPVGSDDSYGPVGWTDAEGKFEIRGLQPGKHRLAVPQWFSRGVLLTGADEVEAGTADLQLTATEGARLAGIVVDEAGLPVAGVEVSATAAPARGGAWTRSQADGTFAMTGLAPGARYDVSARQRGRVPGRQRGVLAGSSDLRLEVSKGLEMEGRLVDATGSPQPHATLRFVAASGGFTVAARTDGEGRFAVSGLLSGTYAVEASIAAGGSVVARPCGRVEAGQRAVELRLSP